MSYTEIKELRKSGNVAEACEQAKRELEEDSENNWIKRELGWCLYTFLKENCDIKKREKFLENLQEISELNFDEPEEMLNKNTALQLNKLFSVCKKMELNDSGFYEKVEECCRNIQWTIPGEAYSMLLEAFTKIKNFYPQYPDFMEWWNLENLREEDYCKQQMSNGKSLMALAEQVLIARVKILKGNGTPEECNAFAERLEKVAEEHKDMQYPDYYAVQLRIRNHASAAEVMDDILPFLKRKKNDFWIWGLMADILKEDKEKRLACLLKALNTGKEEKFLVKIYEKLTLLLIADSHHDEARFILDKYFKIKQNTGTKPSPEMVNFTRGEWYAGAEPINPDHLVPWKKITDDILFGDVPERDIVVTYVNREKNFFNFIYGVRKSGFASYKHMKEPKIGMTFKAKFNEPEKEGAPVKILAMTKSNDISELFFKSVSGEVVPNARNTALFVKNGNERYFLPPALTGSGKCVPGTVVKANAVYDINKRDNTWNWKIISVY